MRETFRHFLRILEASFHFKVFLFNLAVLLMLASFNYWIEIGKLPNNGDSILYIVHVYALRNSILSFFQLPSIDMMQYGGIPTLGVGPLVPFLPLTLIALFTGEIFAYKLLSLIVLAAAGGIMSYYTYSFVHSRIASFVAAIVYVWNPPMLITAVSEGHFDLTWGYMLIPLIFLTTLWALDKSSLVRIGVAGAVFGLMLFAHAQMLLLIGPFYLIFLLVLGMLPPSLRTSKEFKKSATIFAKKIAVLGVIALLGFLLSSIRFLPLILESPYTSSDTLSNVVDYNLLRSFSAVDVFWAMTLRVPSGYGDAFFHNPVAAGPVFFAFAVSVPILAALAFFLDYRSRLTKVSFSLGILAAFFTAGPNAPLFFQPFMWLFQYVPFYNEIRTPGRFAIIVAFFFAFLCGIGAKKISDKVSDSVSKVSLPQRLQGGSVINRRIRLFRKISGRQVTKVYVASMLSVILMLNAALALTSSFVTYDFTPRLMGAYQTIEQQQGDFRFIGLPVATYYAEPVYGTSTNPDCYASIITGKANLFGDGSGASTYLVNYLYYYLNSIITSSNVSYSIGKLLGLYNAKWVILHGPMFYNRTLENLLRDTTLRTIYSSANGSEIVLENVEDPYPLVYNARGLLLFGGPESILAFAGLDQFNLSSSVRWAFTLVSQLGSFKVTNDSISKFDTMGFRENDLKSIAALQYGTSAADILSSSVVFNNGWWTRYFWAGGRWIPQYFNGSGVDLDISATSLYGSYIEAAGNTSAKFRFNFNVGNSGEYEIWTRSWFSENATTLNMTIDESTSSSKTVAILRDGWQFGWHWVNAGTFNLNPGIHSLTIEKNETGFNCLDGFMIILKNSLTSYEDYFTNLLKGRYTNLIYILDFQTSFKSLDNSWIMSSALKGNTSTGRCFSTYKDGAEASAQIFIPKSDNYSLAIRLLQGENRGNLTVYMDGVKILNLEPIGEAKWLTHVINASIYISRGYHNFTIENMGTEGNDIDKLIIAHTSDESNLVNFFSGESSGKVYDCRETSPGVYIASIELSEPSFVVFNVAFHPGWHAFDGKSEYVPVPVNYFVNGFYINNTGRFTLTIIFGLNPPRVVGLYLSIAGLVSLALIIIYGKYGRKRR